MTDKDTVTQENTKDVEWLSKETAPWSVDVKEPTTDAPAEEISLVI